jgi:hypothetical protein
MGYVTREVSIETEQVFYKLQSMYSFSFKTWTLSVLHFLSPSRGLQGRL